MTTAIDDLLSVETLTGLIKTFADQADNRSCSTLFSRAARQLQPEGESASWDEVAFARHLAPVSHPESPHQRIKRLGRRRRTCAMAFVKVYKDLPSSHLFLQRAPGSSLAEAEVVLAAELEDLANLIGNTREFLAAGALLGRIEVNEQTVPGSDLEFTIEFDNQRAVALEPWTDPAAKLRSAELLRVKRRFKDQSGQRAGLAITEPGVEGYLVRNEETKGFAREALGAQILRNLELTGTNPQWDGLAGMSWRFTDGTYKPEDAPLRRYFPADRLLVLPSEDRLKNVLGWAEGKVFVPSASFVGIGSRAGRALGLIQELRGFYAYAEVRTDPAGVRVYAGWYGLPVVLDPNAVLVYRVAPAP